MQRMSKLQERLALEEVRRALMSTRQIKLVKHLDKLWSGYVEARANCEAMSFRGDRMLQQVCRLFYFAVHIPWYPEGPD